MGYDDVPEAPTADGTIIHTWLAWQREPGRPYGTAISERFLDPNVAEARVIAAWLRKLFHPDDQAP